MPISCRRVEDSVPPLIKIHEITEGLITCHYANLINYQSDFTYLSTRSWGAHPENCTPHPPGGDDPIRPAAYTQLACVSFPAADRLQQPQWIKTLRIDISSRGRIFAGQRIRTARDVEINQSAANDRPAKQRRGPAKQARREGRRESFPAKYQMDRGSVSSNVRMCSINVARLSFWLTADQKEALATKKVTSRAIISLI